MSDLILDVLNLVVENGSVVVKSIVDYLVHLDCALEAVFLKHESGLEILQGVFVKASESSQFSDSDLFEKHREVFLGD